MIKFYIGSKIENAAQVRELKAHLERAGWEHTYDWTAHGSVRGGEADRELIRAVAEAEVDGVIAADVAIFLLPGGRGTHVEMGVALAAVPHVVVWSPDPETDFGVSEKTSAFYHHPDVIRCGERSMEDLAASLAAGITE